MRRSASHYEKNNNFKNRKHKYSCLILIYIFFYIKKQFFINKNR